MRQIVCWLAAATACIAATPCHAAWHVAKSKHFIIYSDENPKVLREFATQLERFDQSARIAMNMDDPTIGDGNRLTVFVLPSAKDVRALMGDTSGYFDGFYTGRITGSLAYVPRRPDGPEEFANSLFFHEYSHHLMAQALDRPYPEWYVEGFAEFLSTAKLAKDGSVWFGVPLAQRAHTILNGPAIPFSTLSAGLSSGLNNEQKDAFYGRGWLLAHYLLLEPKRKGQLGTYLNALSNGVAPMAAAQQAFGDLKQLDKDLDRYRNGGMLQFKIGKAQIRLSPIDVTPLSQGAAEVVLKTANLKSRRDDQSAETVAAEIRPIAGRYPGDALVETTLAEAELAAGRADAALAAADRALKTAPQDTEALVLKGRALAYKGEDEQDDKKRNAIFDEARAWLIRANKVDEEDPEPLLEFYKTYVMQGIRPNANALAALHYASDLAPQDLGARMNAAYAYLREEKPKEARAALTIVAYSPHAGSMADQAKAMIAKIDAGDTPGALKAANTAPSTN